MIDAISHHDQLSLSTGDMEPYLAEIVENASQSRASFGAACRISSGGLDFAVHLKAKGYKRHIQYTLDPAGDVSRPDCRVFVCCRGEPGAASWPKWSDIYFRERDVEARLRGGRYRLHYFDECDFWQVYDREAQLGVQLMRNASAYPAWDPGSPLRNFVHWRLIDAGDSLVHAGTLSLGQNGVLLAGPGGSGKSGTVLAGVLHGLQSVGDDYVALSPEPHPVAKRAFRTLKQDSGGLARVGILMPRNRPVNWQGKHLLQIEDVATTPQPDQIDVKAICLPFVSHAKRTTFSPGTARDAFLALAPSGITQIPSARPEMFSFAASLSRSLPIFRVDLSAEPDEIASSFADFIEGQD